MDEPLSFLLDRRMDFANDPDPSTAGLAFLDLRLRSQLLFGAGAGFRPLVVGVALTVVERWFGPLVVVAVARQLLTSGCGGRTSGSQPGAGCGCSLVSDRQFWWSGPLRF
jgi:hypothetical protein